MKKITLFLVAVILTAAVPAFAQTYSAKVQKDSVAVLTSRIDQLKANLKLLELKVKESQEETEVEKLRIKLLKANENAKKSSEKANKGTKSNAGAGSDIDLKELEKLSKKVKSDQDDAQKALERFNKQISKVESIRTQIQTEERKISGKRPEVIFKR